MKKFPYYNFKHHEYFEYKSHNVIVPGRKYTHRALALLSFWPVYLILAPCLEKGFLNLSFWTNRVFIDYLEKKNGE